MSDQNVLVINCGSSSLKFALVNARTGEQPVTGLAERLGTAEARVRWQHDGQSETADRPDADHEAAMRYIIDQLNAHDLLAAGLAAVGHRVVHGGEAFHASTIIDDEVMAAIDECSRLAPLHNPANLLGIRTAQRLFADVPQVAVFDTAFHQSLPAHAYLYPLPYEYYEEQGVRRYGFHGTSHRFVTQKAAEILGKPYDECRLISAHLGNGCSAAAVKDGRSVDTTMGLTPLEGLVMGTRSGNVDPGLHAYLSEQLEVSLDEITNILNKKSGLLGLSGLSNDMRALLDAADEGHERAAVAIDVFCYRLAKQVAGMAVPLGRVDALIFTGGIGEHAAPVRAKTVAHLQVLGYEIDDARNADHGRDNNGIITQPDSPTAVVIPTDEELMIAQDSAALVS